MDSCSSPALLWASGCHICWPYNACGSLLPSSKLASAAAGGWHNHYDCRPEHKKPQLCRAVSSRHYNRSIAVGSRLAAVSQAAACTLCSKNAHCSRYSLWR